MRIRMLLVIEYNKFLFIIAYVLFRIAFVCIMATIRLAFRADLGNERKKFGYVPLGCMVPKGRKLSY